MIEFIQTLPEWLLYLFAGLSAALNVGSISAAVASLVRQRHITKALNDAKQRESYIVCPRCKEKVPLSEISIHLKSGELDNNLNGVPDHLEKHN